LGVNGTSYSCRLNSIQEVFNPNNPQNFVVDIEVYENGEKILSNAKEKYTITKLSLFSDDNEIDLKKWINYD
jgi:hypothetical protein